jgi:hypothetical protein
MDNDLQKRREREEEAAAAAAAGAIGGTVDEDVDPAQRAVVEGGGGVSEGFELAEEELVEHASHGDQHAAGAVLRDSYPTEEAGAGIDYGEGDSELTSEDRDPR